MDVKEFCRNKDFFRGMIHELMVYTGDQQIHLKYDSVSDYEKGQQFMYDLLLSYDLL